MPSRGELKYLTANDGSRTPGLYIYSGSAWNGVGNVNVDAQYPPIYMKAGTGISFNWNSSTKYLTVNATGTATANITGITHYTFTINSDNNSGESAALKFERGNLGADSQVIWDEVNDRMEIGFDNGVLVPVKCASVLCGSTNKVGIASSGDNLVLNVKSGGSVVIQVNS